MPDTQNTGLDEAFGRLRALAPPRSPAPSIRRRRQFLKALRRALLAAQHRLQKAVSQDFGGRADEETLLADILPTVSTIDHTHRHLPRWAGRSPRRTGLLFQPGRSELHFQPCGVVGVMSPWNYPVLLPLGPAIGALAAGNRVMLKVSEATPATNRVLHDIINDAGLNDHLVLVEGEADISAAFAALPFDHLLFTGSTTVGRKVMQAAADNLTPVTLELGGKCPAVIAPDADVSAAAGRILFGKTLNAGQTCIAVDTVLCGAGQLETLLENLQQGFHQRYPDAATNPDYTALISDAHYDRLQTMLREATEAGCRVLGLGGGIGDNRRMPLTLVIDPPEHLRLMQEEIFGPILPILCYRSEEKLMQRLTDWPSPLAIYWFGRNRKQHRRLLDGSRSGAICFNDTLVQVAQDDLPFGGTGPSGFGRYHGEEGFRTFSVLRSCFYRGRPNVLPLVEAPYAGKPLLRLLKWWLKR